MIEIRTFNKEDNFDDLIGLSREFFREYEAYHAEFFKIDDLKAEDVIGYFSSFLDRELRQAFLALDGNRIVGYITVYVKDQADYWQIKQVGDISGLMVQKEYRHRGIANRLLAKAIEFFETQGVKYYTVFTAVENQAGLAFYRQNGLTPLHTTLIGEIQERSTSSE
jgi:ribosomal protein S18 acetylase RimI-like enzyme